MKNAPCLAILLLLPVAIACGSATSEEDAASEGAQASSEAISNSIGQGVSLRTTARVNLREGPSTSDEVILTIPNGATVKTLGASAKNGYFNVSYNGDAGWAYSAYLQKTDGAGSSSGGDDGDGSSSGGSTSGTSGTSSSSSGGGDFHGRNFANVQLRWEGDYTYLANCDPPWGAQFSCNGHPTRDFVDNAAWIAVPHAYFSTSQCNKSARVCKGTRCIVAKIMDRGATEYFEGSTPVLSALGVSAGANGCSSYGTATGVTVTFE